MWVIESRIAAGGSLSSWDVLQVLKWKLGRVRSYNKSTVTPANMDKINEAVRLAKDSNPDVQIRAVQDLDRVPGIGLATATAILTICLPENFTIIDWRALDVLDRYEPFPFELKRNRLNQPDASKWTADQYVKIYVDRVRRLGRELKYSLRDTDRALWGLSVKCDMRKIIEAAA
jgi:hypothetical protein